MSASPLVSDEIPSRGRFSAVWLWLFGAALIACSLIFVVITRHWPIVGDAALIRYSVFLIQHGWAPYRDFVDINMPGAYLMTALGSHLVVSEDVSWRIFDLGLIALAGVGFFVIARPYSRFAALFATTMLLLVHGQDGVQQAGQRDLVIAVLLVLAVVFLLEGVRRERWIYVVPFGLAVGLSATIKPTAGPLGMVLLLIAGSYHAGWWRFGVDGITMRERPATERARGRLRRFLRWTLIGIAAMAAPLAGMLLWLERKHALGAWLMTQRVLLPSYAMQERRPFGFTLSHSISPLLPLVLLWLACVVLRGPAWPQFERALLATGAVVNLLALLAQGKALPYQRYPFMAFLLPLIALDLTTAWRRHDAVRYRRAVRSVAWAGLCCSSMVLPPLAVLKAHSFDARPQEFDAMLATDLRNLHAGDLSGRVQCLDTIQDCLPTLYTLRLLPATGVLGDVELFGPSDQPVVAAARRRFFQQVEVKPPLVFIVVGGFFLDGTSGYRKLDAWPEFKNWLNAHYTLKVERTPPHLVRWWSRPQAPAGYRIYIWTPAAAIQRPADAVWKQARAAPNQLPH
jgi:Dolichyl-phosphate-mannose-protein mannosyltransferase